MTEVGAGMLCRAKVYTCNKPTNNRTSGVSLRRKVSGIREQQCRFAYCFSRVVPGSALSRFVKVQLLRSRRIERDEPAGQ